MAIDIRLPMAVYEQRHPRFNMHRPAAPARPAPGHVASWWRKLPADLRRRAICCWSRPRSRPAAMSKSSNCRGAADRGADPAPFRCSTALDLSRAGDRDGMSCTSDTAARMHETGATIEQRRALLVDPMLATGGSLPARDPAAELLRRAASTFVPWYWWRRRRSRGWKQQYPDVDSLHRGDR